MNQTAIRETALRTIARGQIGYKELIRQVGATKPELDAVLTGLRSDGLIETTTYGYRIAPRRITDAEAAADIRGEQPPQPAAPVVTQEAPAPAPASPAEYLCTKCRAAKFQHEMYRREGKRLSVCKACYQAAIREGQKRSKKREAASAQKDLAQVVKKHTKKPDRGPLQVRHSRELSAEIDELEVRLTLREDDQASGAVTLTYSEAARLREWLNAQDLG
jgi:hypothetical protein